MLLLYEGVASLTGGDSLVWWYPDGSRSQIENDPVFELDVIPRGEFTEIDHIPWDWA